ncbi:MAG: peptide transporter [Clostridia bacterium]|nr:peptide transporter [Clostridia bacterium]
MKDLVRLTDLDKDAVYEIFRIADTIQNGEYQDFLKGKCIVLFFPASSIRTRISFERGVHLLGGQVILFPSDALDKKEDLRDVCGYLELWADLVVVRHRSITLLQSMSSLLNVPVINAMTDVNHPCEMLSDMYALSKIRKDFTQDHFLYVGANTNIGLAWKEAADVMGFHLEQCCGHGFELTGMPVWHSIHDAIAGKDIVCTDSLPAAILPYFHNCQVTADVMRSANDGALLNPCPPFFRGEELSQDAIDSPAFVGYSFKKHLLTVQQAIIIYCLTH